MGTFYPRQSHSGEAFVAETKQNIYHLRTSGRRITNKFCVC